MTFSFVVIDNFGAVNNILVQINRMNVENTKIKELVKIKKKLTLLICYSKILTNTPKSTEFLINFYFYQ